VTSPPGVTLSFTPNSPPVGIGAAAFLLYARCMATLPLTPSNQIDFISPGIMEAGLGKGFALLIAPAAAREGLFEWTATLALRGLLCVLDGGNVFNAYHVARALRRQTAAYQPILERIRLARAFTCFQMTGLIREAATFPPLPLLVLDLLATFSDESVPLSERRRLLQECAVHLHRLATATPIAVWVRNGSDEIFLSPLCEAAGQVWHFEPLSSPVNLQQALF
jgi:hypothetical protein